METIDRFLTTNPPPKYMKCYLDYNNCDGSGYGNVFSQYGYDGTSDCSSDHCYKDGSGVGCEGRRIGGVDRYGGRILSINNFKVYFIDSVPTIIYNIKGNIARGAILRKDLTFKDCYIAKVGDYFAHGETVRKAYSDAKEKAMRDMSVEERIDEFYSAHSDCNKKYPFEDLYKWHNILTGSCELGRREWCKERGITEKDSFTVTKFCKLTKDAYGGDVIKQLIKKLKNR